MSAEVCRNTQARLRGRLTLEPQIDFNAYTTGAVIDWVDLVFRTVRPTQWRWIFAELEKAIGTRSFVWQTRKKPSADNWKMGNLANLTKADAFAHRHRDFVRAEIAKLPSNVELSPSSLARALNEVGFLSSRSNLWTHNSAKNLIERVRKFERS
jgi:hypothetical protein